jgi:hypothetical protein
MATRNTMGTALEPSFVQRVAAGLRYALTGAPPSSDWFGPQQPLQPAVPEPQAEQAGVSGRQFDYPTGYNLRIQPRAGEAIGFPQLRALAENFDLLRLVIETRKDQICALPWSIQPRKKPGSPQQPKPDARCDKITEFLRQPDREHGWEDWLRMLLEDLFVIDAPALYVRGTVGGELFALEPVDGATIKRIIDSTGRTPMDGPAYQQILKGLPAVDYTREELIYKPRNLRTHKVYGYGPVEQIINTVNIAIRRQMFTLNYFTEGTVPDALAGVPADWTITQIKEFQDYWDLLMQDDMASRRKLKYVPGEIAKNFHETKQPPLKDMFDEWLARIVCYCFSIDVTPFVAQVNRAVADTNREQSLSEGIAPSQQWVKSLIDLIIARHFGHADIEFSWQEGEIVDPLKRAQVLTLYVEKKVLHPDEVRADLGRDPLTPEQKADLNPPPPAALGAVPGEEGMPPGKQQDGQQQPPKKPKPGEEAPPAD